MILGNLVKGKKRIKMQKAVTLEYICPTKVGSDGLCVLAYHVVGTTKYLGKEVHRLSLILPDRLGNNFIKYLLSP